MTGLLHITEYRRNMPCIYDTHSSYFKNPVLKLPGTFRDANYLQHNRHGELVQPG